MWLVALLLAGALFGGRVAFLLLMRGKAHERAVLQVDGHAVSVDLRFGSKLPKLLGAAATTVNDVMCFRCYPRSYPQQVVGRPPVSQLLAAHECAHVVRRQRVGYLTFWWEIWRDLLTHPFNHDARPSEKFAIFAAPLILNGEYAGVNAVDVLKRFA